MGFSTCLQGARAHEALLQRQDAEIRLLENIKRCLAAKIKCDKEYSLALSAVATQGLKLERGDEMSDSLVATGWRNILEELDNTGKLMKQNADSVETKALERLATVYTERRKARKQYQEEFNKITQQFSQITEEVARKKAEYQKYLELYKLMRSRFEEHYVKSGRGGRKLEEVRDKYQKACRKLHLAHNEYVLLLCEATEHERELRTVLLPGLLERQRIAQHAFVSTLREALLDVVRLSDPTAERYREIQQRTTNSVEAINPVNEYKDFIDKHKSIPVNTAIFTFDESLVEDTSIKLLANQLTVDNLTVEWLRAKLGELETGVKEMQEKQEAVQSETVANGRTSLGSSHEVIPRIPDVSKKELDDLRCHEHKLTKQMELIKSALNELGCEEVPSGCDLSMEHQSFIENSNDNQADINTAQQPLANEEWFHGFLPREEVCRLLRKDGDFLVRETTRNDECQTVLSVCWAGHKHFIVQTTAEGHYRFEGPAFPSIRELILHQQASGLPVTARSGAILRQSIPRERWELNNDNVQLIEKIGRGNFGEVYKAQLKNSNREVAVKICKMTVADEEHKKKFLQEGRILKQYDHPNIVKLIGICVQKQPIMIVMELVPGGSLLTFLRNSSSNLKQRQLMAMCRDTAAGMRYLESKNCIHRDLAARNCLVGYENMVKISDFGMSREEEEYIVSDGMKQIPIKWTAPEALNFGKYTSLCDVWSYGILIWEIFSRGGTPYNGLSNSKARERIDAGYRMPAPDGTPEEMYRLMLRCWEYKPEKRPHFEQIYSDVDTLYSML